MTLLSIPAIVHLCVGLTNVAMGTIQISRNQKLVGMTTMIIGSIFISLYAIATYM